MLGIGETLRVPVVETYYCGSSVSHSHWNHQCLENSFLCLTHMAETLDVWRWNRLALATYYDILYVSRLFEIRDSGGFPTFHGPFPFLFL